MLERDPNGPAVNFVPADVALKQRREKARQKTRNRILSVGILAAIALSVALANVLLGGRPKDLGAVAAANQTQPSQWEILLVDQAGKESPLAVESVSGASYRVERKDLRATYGSDGQTVWALQHTTGRLYTEPVADAVGPEPKIVSAVRLFQQGSAPNATWFQEKAKEQVDGRTLRRFVDQTTEYRTHFWVEPETLRIVKIAVERPRSTGWRITEVAYRKNEAPQSDYAPPAARASTALDAYRESLVKDIHKVSTIARSPGWEYRVHRVDLNRFGTVYAIVSATMDGNRTVDVGGVTLTDENGRTYFPETYLEFPYKGKSSQLRIFSTSPPPATPPKRLTFSFATPSLNQPQRTVTTSATVDVPGPTCSTSPDYLYTRTGAYAEDVRGFQYEMAKRITDVVFSSSNGMVQSSAGTYLAEEAKREGVTLAQYIDRRIREVEEVMDYSAWSRESGFRTEGVGRHLMVIYHLQMFLGLEKDSERTLRTAWEVVKNRLPNQQFPRGYFEVVQAVVNRGLADELGVKFE